MASGFPIPSPLSQRTDHWFKRARAALLSQVPCRAGCSRCCIGPFPITVLDTHLLNEGLSRLPTAQRDQIEERAREQITAMETAFPRLHTSPYLDKWPDREVDHLVSDFHESPCPALDHNGHCSLYEHRPLTCRSMGIPTEDGGITNGACEVQTFVPLVRLSAHLRAEVDRLAEQEGTELDAYRAGTGSKGEEVLLPYGFLPPERLDRG